MYPYNLIPGLTLYDLLFGGGIVAAIIIFRLFADRDKVSIKYNNFVLYTAMVTVVLGYGGAIFSQAIYNMFEDGKFELSTSTGATFLGGLIGGAAVFIIFYFGVGHFVFNDKEHINRFGWISDVGAVSIPAAHAIGRLGCLSAGCCHGKVYDEKMWYTFKFLLLNSDDDCIGEFYALPVQLYEALFLFVLAGVIAVLKINNKRNLLSVYMISYGVWRFCIEYLRGDDRGQTIVSFLSPSQLTSLLLIVIGIVVTVLFYIDINKKKTERINEEKI